jgi:tRNA-specific 2-thiouridylase
MKNRVVVAMSGGVDSSVAVALLKEQGFEVIGITMCFNLPDSAGSKQRCCGWQAIEDARSVAHRLGIKHYVVNMQKVLEQRVIKNFCLEYLSGRTPNPCVRCNQYVKFDALLKKALSLGASYLATGHYARIIQGKAYFLKKARDLKKDQSYFLYRLKQAQLKRVLFPLGEYTKAEVRALARKFHLAVAEKPGSQEICFLPDMDYRGFLERYCAGKPKIRPGMVTDTTGKKIGEHKGVAFYTIGQRQGLGIAAGKPVYVINIDRRRNRIIVGTREETLSREFLIKNTHFILPLFKKRVAFKVKIRYNHKEMMAKAVPQGNKIKILFRKPQFAITPGQSAVFYAKDKVLGGGIIDKVLG